MPNPFKVLGLTPGIIKKAKTDDSIMLLVRAAYKTLSKLYHPDLGGKASDFKAIAEALVLLEDPIEFDWAKEEYLASEVQKVRNLHLELASQRALRRQMTKQMVDYLKSLAVGGGLPLNGRTIHLASDEKDVFQTRLRQIDAHSLEVSEFFYAGKANEYLDLVCGDYFLADGSYIRVLGREDKRSAQIYTLGEPRVLEAVALGSILDSSHLYQQQKDLLAIEGLTIADREYEEGELLMFEKALPFITPRFEEGNKLLIAYVESGIRLAHLGKIIKIFPTSIEPIGIR